jgi:hypothetical protein
MREVGAFEAKNKLGQLLGLVGRGEAYLVLPHQAFNRELKG